MSYTHKPDTEHILHVALRDGCDDDVVQLLLDSGSLCDKISIDMLASQSGEYLNVFKMLKESNVQQDAKAHFRELAVRADSGWDHILNSADRMNRPQKLTAADIRPAFFNAAKFGRVEVVERMISIIRQENEGLDINMTDAGQDVNALQIACAHGHPLVVEVLVREGIDIDRIERSGKTALILAAEGSHKECAEILLQNGCDIRVADKERGVTALHVAADQRDTQMLETMMRNRSSKGASLYQKTKEGYTLLHGAAMRGSLSVLKFITQHFPEASIYDLLNDGSNSLHIACASKSGSLEVVRFLLDEGLPVNAWNDKNMSPVTYAVESVENSTELVKLLHSRGADLNASKYKGDIPLFCLIRQFREFGNRNMVDCFNYILDQTLDINYCDEDGCNALHWLAIGQPEHHANFYIETVCLTLLTRGCSLTKHNNKGDSAFQLFVANWSELAYDSIGFFAYLHTVSDEERDDFYLIPRYDGMRPQVGMTLLICAHAKADAEIIGQPGDINCLGSGLLSLAVRTANRSIVSSVLKYDSDVDRRDVSPGFPALPLNTPLEWMCSGLDPGIDIIEQFLSSTNGLESRRPDGLAPIHLAAVHANDNVIAGLLQKGVNVDCLCSNGLSPLMYACDHRRLSTIRFLYEQGARAAVSEKWDVLEVACQAGDKDVLITLLEMPELKLNWKREFDHILDIGPRINGVANTKVTVTYLILAAYKGHEHVMEWLMSNDLTHDVNFVVGKGHLTPVYSVVGDQGSYKDTLPFLLSKGADLSITSLEYRWTPLHAAAEAGNEEVIKLLLKSGANCNAKDKRQFTPQLVALECNNLQAARLLKNRTNELKTEADFDDDADRNVKNEGASLDETTKYGDKIERLGPPLHSCAKAGDVWMVRKLLDDGAHVDIRLENGSTPAMKAARGGSCEVLDLLKERGAEMTAKDIAGGGALHHAAIKGQTIVIPGLLACGLSLLEADADNRTPLHLAVNAVGFDKDFHESIMRWCGTSVRTLSPSLLCTLAERAVANRVHPVLEWMLNLLDEQTKRNIIESGGGRFGSLLQFAAARGNHEVFDILIEGGGDINHVKESKETPLACAASMGRVKAVQELAKRGASLTYVMPNGTQRNAIDAAKSYPQIQDWLRRFYENQASRVKKYMYHCPRRLSDILEEEAEDPAIDQVSN